MPSTSVADILNLYYPGRTTGNLPGEIMMWRLGIGDGDQPKTAYRPDAFDVIASNESHSVPAEATPRNVFDHIPQRSRARAAAWAGFLDGAAFGLPRAGIKRFAPETGRDLDAFLAAYPVASAAGGLAGAVGSPANGLYRAAGDALARRGSRIVTQAAADAATAGAIFAAPGVIAGEVNPDVVGMMVPVALASRFMMPELPNSLWRQATLGGAAGGLSGTVDAVHGNLAAIPAGVAIGGLYGAALRGRRETPGTWEAAANSAGRRRFIDWNLNAMIPMGAARVLLPQQPATSADAVYYP